VKVNEIIRHYVDKVALTARWLVIHRRHDWYLHD